LCGSNQIDLVRRVTETPLIAASGFFDVIGASISVEADSTATLEVVNRLWQPFAVIELARDPIIFSIREQSGRFYLSRDRGPVSHGDIDFVLAELSGQINRAAIDQCQEFAIHSGVVKGSTSAIAFPAESGQGKSTLATACLRAGFGYVSDEALCIEDAGTIRPYPKPLALDRHSLELVLPERTPTGGETLLTAADFAAGVVVGSQTLGHLVVLDRSGEPPELEPLGAGAAVERLLRLSFNHYRRPEAAYRLAVAAARTADVWRLRYHDPLVAGRLLFERLGE